MATIELEDNDAFAQFATDFLTTRMGYEVTVRNGENFALGAIGIPARKCHGYVQSLDCNSVFKKNSFPRDPKSHSENSRVHLSNISSP